MPRIHRRAGAPGEGPMSLNERARLVFAMLLTWELGAMPGLAASAAEPCMDP